MASLSATPDVYTPDELAEAAGCDPLDVMALVESGAIASVPGSDRIFIPHAEALRAGVALVRHDELSVLPAHVPPDTLFDDAPGRHAGVGRTPFAVSSILHGGLALSLAAFATLGLTPAARSSAATELRSLGLVYLALPGPGGGGGGGGERNPLPAPKAHRSGSSRIDSPVPVAKAAPVRPAPPQAPLPEVEAPVVALGGDQKDVPGVPKDVPVQADSRGTGEGGGIDTGAGTGVGEGHGAGVGPGDDRGAGGGPYRPGSGITPPRLLRQVRPDYTEDARARSLEGEVVMEVVVRRDGTIGSVRVLQGLGHGLDERAVQAVRQWSFAPGELHGTPVDVLVEVAMEFRIR